MQTQSSSTLQISCLVLRCSAIIYYIITIVYKCKYSMYIVSHQTPPTTGREGLVKCL